MKNLFALLAMMFCASVAMAQFNDTTHYHINVAATGSINKADQTTAYLLNNAVNFNIKQKDYTLNATNTWIYGKSNGLLTNNDYSSAVFFNLYKTFPHFYYWGLANYNTSYSLKINNQLLAGAGIAYNVLDKPNAYLNFSDGILFDQSDLVTTANYHTYRNSFRLAFHFATKELLTLDGSNFWQPSLSNHKDYIIKSTTTLGLKLRKWISLTTSLTYNKMNITSSDNLIFTYGLTIDKYF